MGYSPWGHKELETTEKLTVNLCSVDFFKVTFLSVNFLCVFWNLMCRFILSLSLLSSTFVVTITDPLAQRPEAVLMLVTQVPISW